ncbi:MAG: calcium-binding protein [Calothrix sp. CSU_2_0]|nr:calcium-binding protein [Calothrix sp. CSU_2_0]
MAIINGTSGKDELRTLGSNDELLGLEGNDILDAATGTGKNILRGGEGNDELFAYTEDELYGDKGDDILYSDGKGNNKLYGGEDNDIIFPDINDQVFGDNGDDVIYAGDGGSSFTGGIGLDIFWMLMLKLLKIPILLMILHQH